MDKLPPVTRVMLDIPAEEYDRRMAEMGYQGPARAAEALAGLGADRSAALIEFGAGTGLVGQALRACGFTTLDGLEPSGPMLALARRKTGIYRTLYPCDWDAPLPVGPGQYRNAAAIGILAPGYAPAAVIDSGLALLPKDGLFVFSLSDLARGNPDYVGRIRENVDAGAAEIAFREYSHFLPGAQLRADIYVLRKR